MIGEGQRKPSCRWAVVFLVLWVFLEWSWLGILCQNRFLLENTILLRFGAFWEEEVVLTNLTL